MAAAAANKSFPDLLFVHRASVEASDKFFQRYMPGAHVVIDPDGELYAAFELRRGSWLQLVGPRIWWRALVALCRGNPITKPTGNELQMPGAFLVHGEQILWQHRARNSADHPDLSAMQAALAQSR